MTKEEYLTTDILSLQKILVEKTTKKENLEADIKRLHTERAEAEQRLRKPMVEIESALQLLRIESESLAVQIEARKKELLALEGHHKIVHESHGTQVVEKKRKLESLQGIYAALQQQMEALLSVFAAKQKEITDLTEKIQVLEFEVTNYQKTILVADNQLKEIMENIRVKSLIERKLDARIKELKRTHHIVVEDVLTERNKRLWKRHEQRTGMNKALDKQIERKQQKLK